MREPHAGFLAFGARTRTFHCRRAFAQACPLCEPLGRRRHLGERVELGRCECHRRRRPNGKARARKLFATKVRDRRSRRHLVAPKDNCWFARQAPAYVLHQPISEAIQAGPTVQQYHTHIVDLWIGESVARVAAGAAVVPILPFFSWNNQAKAMRRPGPASARSASTPAGNGEISARL
jgi:hypothetical protein